MMSKFCSFATLVLTLSSLNAVNATPQIGSDIQFGKRDANVKFTTYRAGLGACGHTNANTDFVVALNAQEYGTSTISPHCFQNININVGGKTTTAQIVDVCATCSPGGLALSTGLHQFFAPLSQNPLTGDWSYA